MALEHLLVGVVVGALLVQAIYLAVLHDVGLAYNSHHGQWCESDLPGNFDTIAIVVGRLAYRGKHSF